MPPPFYEIVKYNDSWLLMLAEDDNSYTRNRAMLQAILSADGTIPSFRVLAEPGLIVSQLACRRHGQRRIKGLGEGLQNPCCMLGAILHFRLNSARRDHLNSNFRGWRGNEASTLFIRLRILSHQRRRDSVGEDVNISPLQGSILCWLTETEIV